MRELPCPFSDVLSLHVHWKLDADLAAYSMVTLIVADWLGVITR